MKNRVLIIVGPTAVGKTGVSLSLAKQLENSEIISADSRQIYKYMNIGTAKPTQEELTIIPHHFIDIKYPDEYYSAGKFGREARRVIDNLLNEEKTPIVVGGSGLYIRALVDGFFEKQIFDQQVKARLKEEMNKTKIQFADMLAEQKAKFEKEVSDIHKYVEKNLNPVLDLFNEITDTPEGKALLKKLREEKQAKLLQDIAEADEELPDVNKEKKAKKK